jgi:putative component of toxin-antitoxin plasmid stabilization module
MYSVIETDEFSEWLAGLKDVTKRLRLNATFDEHNFWPRRSE